jgi:phosphatidate cytidylyltransferase
MPLHIQTFKTRALTALIFVAIMLAGLLINHWTFFVLFSIIHFGCWIEYEKLVGLIDNGYAQINVFHKYAVMLAGWCIMLYFTNDAFTLFGGRLHAMGWWLGMIAVFLLPVMELLFARQLMLKNIGYSLLGLLYISLSWGLMMDLRSFGMIFKEASLITDKGYIIPCGLIFSIWINDTMAYIVGSVIGKTPFSKISPKKTWEGTAGGAILCVVVMGLLGWWSKFYSVQDWIVIAAIAAIVGTAGDLLESKLKRMAGVKDSGNLLPGHGGFLDRFDSLILATPFVWLYVKLFMQTPC